MARLSGHKRCRGSEMLAVRGAHGHVGFMRSTFICTVALALIGCGGSSDGTYQFVGNVTACEMLEHARTHAELLDDDDVGAAREFASGRCFRVEQLRRVVVVDEPFGGALRGSGRWVRVQSSDGEPMEHHASAELRLTLGLETRTAGWVRYRELSALP